MIAEMAERGHSCPQQLSNGLCVKYVAADRNVRAPPAPTDRLFNGLCSDVFTGFIIVTHQH